jgi:hypothetical protein
MEGERPRHRECEYACDHERQCRPGGPSFRRRRSHVGEWGTGLASANILGSWGPTCSLRQPD